MTVTFASTEELGLSSADSSCNHEQRSRGRLSRCSHTRKIGRRGVRHFEVEAAPGRLTGVRCRIVKRAVAPIDDVGPALPVPIPGSTDRHWVGIPTHNQRRHDPTVFPNRRARQRRKSALNLNRSNFLNTHDVSMSSPTFRPRFGDRQRSTEHDLSENQRHITPPRGEGATGSSEDLAPYEYPHHCGSLPA